MSIGQRLSYSLDCRDQGPNKQLAGEIADAEDEALLKELVDFFQTKPHQGLQKDCAVTLAYIAEKKPRMLVPYFDFLIGNMDDKINRVIWGSMMTLAHIAPFVADELYHSLPAILDAMDKGTVVTRDYGFRILVELYKLDSKQGDMYYIISEQLTKAPDNQLGQYTERFAGVVSKEHKPGFIEVLEERKNDLSNEYHLKRLVKNLKALYK